MTTDRKPARQASWDVLVDAPADAVWEALTTGEGIANWFPPVASTSGEGVGSGVTFSWGEAMTWTSNVSEWEPGRHVQWMDDAAHMGPGATLVADWTIESEGGKTRVRLVQSGFGDDIAWDGFFEGTDIGWRYFLINLKRYVEDHRGRNRMMAWRRITCGIPREAAWKHLGQSLAGSAGFAAGDVVSLRVGDASVPARVEMVVPLRAMAFRIGGLANSLLFIELEGGAEFGVGIYLSVYDPAAAAQVEPAFKAQLESLSASLAGPQAAAP
ncbi:MAG: SRPBCC domain-containing protein [Betaproteobacteria bacterium]|nr:SRPBCC domain-containing protein [Betaproteobacteria bacterium]